MDEQTINNLKEALQFSPNNVPLKTLLAESLFKMGRLDEAEQEYLQLLQINPDVNCKLGLAKTFFAQNEYSKCNVILEQLLDEQPNHFDVLLLYTKALVKEQSIQKAIDYYKKVITINPSFKDEELDDKLRLSNSFEKIFDEENQELDNRFLQKSNIDFSHVGGMESVKKEIDLKIIKPLLHPELYKAYGKKVGGGILLYGPPGCGKTYIAKATAGQINAKFISVSLSDILDMWVGNSEKNLHEIFELARKNTPCVLFFDEIDALGASRSDMKQSSGRHLINQFLQELDGIDNSNDGILVLGATNTPWHLDTAFRRPGRFDRIVFVPPPDEEAKISILKLKLANKPIENIDYKAIAKKIENYSGADIEALIDVAIEEKLEQVFKDGITKPILTKDILLAMSKQKASTQEWFSTAKNFALFANDGGLYDDILTYMKIKK